MSTVSAIVITRNEEKRIEQCLSSLKWANEIIVVDNGSTDNTRKIAEQHGATVISAGDVHDFGKLRTIGKEKSQSEWLFYVDADEIVTEELQRETQRLDSRFPACREAWRGNDKMMSGYEIRRKNYYLGYPWPGDEYILRLIRKDAFVEWYGELHETARIKGEIGRLNAPIVHNTHRTLEEMVEKTNEWSEIEAQLRLSVGHPPIVWWRLFRVMVTAFHESFIHQRGFQAGVVGLIESMYQAFSIFITYAKLWEMQEKSQKSKVLPCRQAGKSQKL